MAGLGGRQEVRDELDKVLNPPVPESMMDGEYGSDEDSIRETMAAMAAFGQAD